MEKISIKKLSFLYNNYKSRETISLNKIFQKYNYLNLSVHFSRDEREFDKSNYKLLSNLISKKKIIKNELFKNGQKISGFKKYLISFKEYSYLPNKKLPLTYVVDILKFGKQIIDIFGIILIVFISLLINFILNFRNQKIKLRNQKIYSIYYWNKKKSNSASYYYPSINSSNRDLAFISSFADSKLFCFGLIDSLINADFLSPEKVLNLKGLSKSILQFIHLFFYDLSKPFLNKDCSFLSFWIGWKKASEIFYSILTYNSLIELTSNSKNCEFIAWHENQVTNRSYALGVSSLKIKSLLSSSTLTSFNGSLFTQQIKNQFLPLDSEVKVGLWGDKYYLQDKGSLREMNLYLSKKNINISLEVVPKSMIRTKMILENKIFKFQISRGITIFTHNSYWDLTACLLAIFNNNNKISLSKILTNKNKKIFIRLHPALTKKEALEELRGIKEIQSFNNLEFIDNKKESFFTSLSLSRYSFFGESSSVNLALEYKASVFAVETNHINKPPIKGDLVNSPNLTFISPW